MAMSTFKKSAASPPPPPWEVILLLSQYLDPKTLTLASYVCRSWNILMSSDLLWRPICHSHYPSLSSPRLPKPATMSYRILFALLQSSPKRRLRRPSKPRISLHQLIFAVDVFNGDLPVFSVAVSGEDFGDGQNGVFQFDIDTGGDAAVFEIGPGFRAIWTVVMKDWSGAFVALDGGCRGKWTGSNDLWFSEELPPPPCCSTEAASGLVAEAGLHFSGAGRRRVARVCLGLMSVCSWRYVGVDDGLTYLMHFLLPSNL